MKNKNKTILKDCKEQLENVFREVHKSAELSRIEKRNKFICNLCYGLFI